MAAAAKALGVSSGTVRRWCANGDLVFKTLPSGHRLIPIDSVNELKAMVLGRRPGGPFLDTATSESDAVLRVLGFVISESSYEYACIEEANRAFRVVSSGRMKTPGSAIGPALMAIVDRMEALIRRLQPTAVVTQIRFQTRDISSAVRAARADALIVILTANRIEYVPEEISKAVSGSSRASLETLRNSVTRVLALPTASPHLKQYRALALCWAHVVTTRHTKKTIDARQ